MTSKYKSNRRIGKGWYYESERHRLARLGIKTSKVNYQKKGKFVIGTERAKKKHPLLVGMTKGALYGTILQTPFGTLAGMPVGAYTQKKILEAEKKERKYQREHRGKKFGKGWFRESERHRLARLGLKTGTKQKEKLSLIFKTPIPFVPMTLGLSPGSKKLLGRRARKDIILSTLKKRGWKVKYSDYPPPGQYELSKGKNYLLLAVSHWKKLKIDKVYIHDKDVGDRLTKLFRRPYPYKIKDYAKSSVQQQINTILYNPKSDAKDKEVLTIEIPRDKSQHLKFLKSYTRFKTKGLWKGIEDNNIQVEVEFKDSKDEKYGKRLINLFNTLNKDKIKEDVLYVRTEPVEESSLR